eukprot:g810.t1
MKQATLLLLLLVGVSAYGELQRTCVITGHGLVRFRKKITERACANIFMKGGTRNPDPDRTCTWNGKPLCLPGKHVVEAGLQTHGKCDHPIKTEEQCREAVKYLHDNTGTKEKYVRRTDQIADPVGCFKNNEFDGNYYFNQKRVAADCSKAKPCLCAIQTCAICPMNTFSEGGAGAKCQPCPSSRPFTMSRGSRDKSKCKRTCEPGYEFLEDAIKSGVCNEPIESKDECHEAAIAAKTKDHNDGFAEVLDNDYDPPGCFLNNGFNRKYYFNKNKKSHAACGHDRKLCICKKDTQPKVCAICPKNTYGNGVSCKACPSKKPSTMGKTGCTSMDDCVMDSKCDVGHGYDHDSKTCVQCKVNEFSKGGQGALCQACPRDKPYTKGRPGQKQCFACPLGHEYNGGKTCTKCPVNYYSDDGSKECKPCPDNKLTYTLEGATSVAACNANNIDAILKKLDEHKETMNDLSIRNSRLWQKENIRIKYAKLMQEREPADNGKEYNYCKMERESGTVVFPAVPMQQELELNEDTGCIDTNRDQLLRSFCSFRSDLQELFEVQKLKLDARQFWPNICCKERRGESLGVCADETNAIKRENIIPFALSQGGAYSKHNLYAEVLSTMREGGYIHAGLRKMIQAISGVSQKHKLEVSEEVDEFFEGLSFCGPRIVNSPGNTQDATKLCQLFVPYKHAMQRFYTAMHWLFDKNIDKNIRSERASLLQTMAKSLKKRQTIKSNRRLQNSINVASVLKGKTVSKDTNVCRGTRWAPDVLEEKKRMFCKGYSHLDLANDNTQNIALQYLGKDLGLDDKEMFALQSSLRYDVSGGNCPSKIFGADDISIQRVSMDTFGKKKEWVAVVALQTSQADGYFKRELPYCESREYLITDMVSVNAYVAAEGCCAGTPDNKNCKRGCTTRLQNAHGRPFSKDVMLTGTTYTVSDPSSRRRRLLQRQLGGS